jgi:hypothetical protein
MGGLCLTNRRAAILCALVVCCLVVSGPVEVKAEVVEDLETITIDPGEYHNVSLYLAQDEILYARFRITNGEGIYFFIVDQDGQDAIMNGSEPTTRYEEHTYPAQEARLNIVFFFATHDSTWYAWFSKVSGDPFADSAATIEGRVGRDIDGPVILETHIPDGPLTGTVEVSFSVRDDGFSINNVKLLANDTVVATLSSLDLSQTENISGSEVEGVLSWDTTRNENSVYVLKVVAYDTWSHTSESAGVLRTVNNGFWDYPTNRMIVITAVVLGVVLGFAWYNKVNNTRLYSYVKSWNRRNWIELIIIVSIILLLILAGSQPVIF